ncbi:MAG: 4'-phosphopantetheinyl transferase superfamily protein [Proteobacteria bacterium]|nr:4'-phosphopantetheinyl transferase superfamily protein [Pseudomonadota bacterium]
MHWLHVDRARLADGVRRAEPLDLWWWPEALYPPAAGRRQRTDTILRTLLAPYLALAPEQLRFGREPHGRPFLQHAGAPDFNLSDTTGGTALAIAAHGRVGVDIERRDRAVAVQALADRWFAAEEADRLRALAPAAARLAFLHLWTAKEAACKATGTGIFGHLREWRFAVDDGDGAPHLLALPDAAGARSRWRFHRLAPTPEHSLVLACDDLAATARGMRVG